jgi:probable phosphoglycerate mutase
MKLLIVRHADPDYSIDSLTPTGWIEAELLSHRLAKLDVKAFYTSPLGRAKDTASLT